MKVEDKLLKSHDDRVQGITAFAFYIMKHVCHVEMQDGIAIAAAGKITEDWLNSDINEEKLEKGDKNDRYDKNNRRKN